MNFYVLDSIGAYCIGGKMKKLRIISALLLVVVMLLTVVGCKGKDEESEKDSDKKVEEKTEAAEDAGKEEAEETEEAKEEETEKAEEEVEEVEEEPSDAAFELANPDSKLVYVIAASRENAYFDAIYNFSEKRLVELGYEAKLVSHDDDAQKESQLFDSAISDKALAIICDNAGSDASIESVKKATDAGVPVFLLDREINENGIAITQITANNYSGASEVAMAFAEGMGEEGKYAELVGKESDTQSKIRSDAFAEVLSQYPDLELVSQQSANWDRNEAFAKVESVLQENPDIKGIICGNDDMALGALAAAKAAGKEDIVIAGFDGIDEVLEGIRNGEIVATAMDLVSTSATMCVDQMDLFVKTGSTGQPEKQLVDCLLITKDNVDNVKDFAIIE